MKEIVKVWPLRTGITGCNANGIAVALTPGLAGWMTREQLNDVLEDIDVQVMAGLRPQDLMKPDYATKDSVAEEPPKQRRMRGGTYKRRDMKAENS